MLSVLIDVAVDDAGTISFPRIELRKRFSTENFSCDAILFSHSYLLVTAKSFMNEYKCNTYGASKIGNCYAVIAKKLAFRQ